MKLKEKDRKTFLRFQREEITAHIIYQKLASIEKDASNRRILQGIAAQEATHYDNLKRYTGIDVKPYRRGIVKYYWLARVFGITFAIKLMEADEESSSFTYAAYTDYPELLQMAQEEEMHENELIAMIKEERLSYMGSVVLGLNDALVEFTGALAGYTMALKDSKSIAFIGSITGIAAALSMASSEYLSTKSETDTGKHPVKSALYTGIAYLITVLALITPFILFENVLISLIVMLAMAILIIGLFNYYYSVAKSENFRKRFGEMAVLSLGVALISFLIGFALKQVIGIEI
ncbi:MAG TPA: rubrerythrin family protein [Porphyromonadaceae bacterium]|jgi:VIT1/CCC1 family predicted Fe2+/Mn2+ transporter|nr:rubrerythrin family protein [Porphyromonadaceae bacterium]HBX21382.1 rubrerythrin family protein [Porphyromonadaceae bacterium]HCM21412.1 rubrerythrin family protein [Porphyromonadaceae bacterium]